MKEASSSRHATGATKPSLSSALCCDPCCSARDFHWRFLRWQEKKKEPLLKRAVK